MLTTECYIGVFKIEGPNGEGAAIEGLVPIAEAEHAALAGAYFRVTQFVEQQSFALVSRNYDALHAAFERARDHDHQSALAVRALFHELQLAVLDWLLATRLYLDHTRYEITDRLGSDSTGLAAWDQARQAEHRDHMGYRVLYELRDYCTHRGLPPLGLVASAHVNRPPVFEVNLNPDELLASFDWKRHARADLEGMTAPQPLMPLAQEFMECLTRLAGVAQHHLAPGIVTDATNLLAAAERVESTDGEPTLFALQVDEGGAPRQLTPTPIPVVMAQMIVDLFPQ